LSSRSQDSPNGNPFDPRAGIRAFLALDTLVRLVVWAGSFTVATACVTALGHWPDVPLRNAALNDAWVWALAFVEWIALFNVAYVLILVAIRLPIPTPKEGAYSLHGDRAMSPQLVWSCLLATLTKARFDPPFPGFLVYQTASLPPLCWIVNRVLGPRTRSCNVTEPLLIDPHLIEIGRNVVIGYRALIAGHTQGRDGIVVKKTRIEDDVMIGGDALIYSGCRIKRGAIILGGAVVRPDTIVGEYEVWGGVPARKIKDLPPAAASGNGSPTRRLRE
jgi:hypothetical protein